MTKRSIRDVLAANLSQLMDGHPILNTQMRLAQRSGVAQRTIGRMRNAEVDPQLGHVEAVAKALGVQVTTLLTDSGTEPASLEYDRDRVARLGAEDRAKIQTFIEFVLSTSGSALDQSGTTLNVSKIIQPTKAQRDTVRRVAQRPLSNKSLSIDAEKPTTKDGKRIRR